jgi:hypothetical protein
MNARDNLGMYGGTQPRYVNSNALDDLICLHCLGDRAPPAMAARDGVWGTCVACGDAGYAMPLERIAAELDSVIKKLYYGALPMNRSDDTGSDLRSIVRELVEATHAAEDAVIEALQKCERKTSTEGTFYSDTALYQKRECHEADFRQ